MKVYHDHDNSYKGKYLIGTGVQLQMFNPLSSLWEAWQNEGRLGAGKAKSSTSLSTGSRRGLSSIDSQSLDHTGQM